LHHWCCIIPSYLLQCIQNWLMRQNTCPVCRTEF